jgi:anthranilate synthase component I
MISPPLSNFKAYATQGNFVPVYQEWLADLDTPVSAWYKVCAGPTLQLFAGVGRGGRKPGPL